MHAVDLLSEWKQACRFPARLRLYAARGLAGLAPEARWVDATPEQRLAAAQGAAVSAPGRSVAVLSGDEVIAPGVLDILPRLQGVDILSDRGAPVRATNWHCVDSLPWDETTAPAVGIAPVHLPGLIAWESQERSLEDLSGEHPRIVVAERNRTWSSFARTPFGILVLAAAAEQGLRPVVGVEGESIGSWWDALAAIGRRQLPCCLRVSGRVPPYGWWRSLPGWWITAPSPPSLRGVLTRAVGSRDTVAIIEPGAEEADQEGHEPGNGRWWLAVDDAQVAVVAPGRARDPALEAVAALTAMGLRCAAWELTSIVPLALPPPGLPLVVVEGDLEGLGDAVRAERGPEVPVLHDGATIADIAAAVRGVVGT